MTTLSELAAAHPDTPALRYHDRQWTYRELSEAADAAANAMRAGGLAGERVVLMMSNSPDLVIAYLACFRAGAVAVPLNARYAAPEVERVLRRAAPRWLLVQRDRAGLLAQVDPAVLDGVRVIVAGDGFGESAAGAPSVPRPDDPAVIFFTSGSTGQPKGVVHSHASALAMLTSTSEALGDITKTDTTLVFEPQVHVSGFIATFSTLLNGGTVALHDGFDTRAYVQALITQRPTLICTHIDVLAQLMRVPGACRDWFASLRGVYTGGDAVPAAIHKEFRALSGLPIGVGYGMTEAIWLTVVRDGGRDGCIGRPVGGARLRVDDVTSELLVAGPMVMQRYWQDAELTASMLVDGWFRTGDLGRCDDDGVWWFTGRIKDVIVRRTSKITPGEVEEVLATHPDVAMAAVVAAADPEEGQVPVAFVVPRAGTAPTPDDLSAFLHGRIAEYKIPVRVHLRASLPLTASGKLSKRDLREDG